jgi:decaprenyl-phosphate phosphoribosyltransferase
VEKFSVILRELRYHQWVKNLVVFLPVFFGGMLTDLNSLILAGFAFVIFTLSASLVYIVNDYRDIEEDKLHPVKKLRPLASGAMSVLEARIIAIILILLIFILLSVLGNKLLYLIIIFYIGLNFAYSYYFKKIPYLELITVAIFYNLRLLGGGISTDIEISLWLNLIVFFGALFVITGKRISEKQNSAVRSVLKKYSPKALSYTFIFSAVICSAVISEYVFVQGLVYIPLSILFMISIVRYIQLVITHKQGESLNIFLDKYLVLSITLFTLYSLIIIYLR